MIRLCLRHTGLDGQRISKTVGDPLNGGYKEYYLRDAQGNIMATYKYADNGTSLKVTDRPVYGSSRIGSFTRQMELMGEPAMHQWPYTQPMQAPLKRYELTDHLGNVATVVTGRLLPLLGPGVQYQAEVVSATLHEPFGLELTGMNWQSNVSRFGFQNQIKDLELNSIHFKYREYFPSDGVFTTIDPLWAKYPWNSPYAFSENRVIDGIEMEGQEWENFKSKFYEPGELKVQLPDTRKMESQRYRVSVANPTKEFSTVKSEFMSNPSTYLNSSSAEFNHPVDGKGEPAQFAKGNYIRIDIFGLMNNSYIKIMDITESETSVTALFATMEGHVEKGVIEFSFTQEKSGNITFDITSGSETNYGSATDSYMRRKQSDSWKEVLGNVVNQLGGEEVDRQVISVPPHKSDSDDK